MSLTPEDLEILSGKKKGRKSILTPEQKLDKKKAYDREFEKTRGDRTRSVRIKPEVLELVQPYLTDEKTLNALINEALLVYKNTVPLPK